MRTLLAMALAFTVLGAMPSLAQDNPGKGDTTQIAEEAFIYGFPMVMNYTVFHDYFIDKSAPGYKAPLNTLYNTGARVYAAGHHGCHAQQRHAVLVRRNGPPGRAVRDL